MTVTLSHSQSGMLKTAPIGFSWTTFFFGPFPALFRGDLKWFFIMLIVEVCTFWVANFIIFGAIYNKRYLVDLLSSGFVPADDHSRNVLATRGLVGGNVSSSAAVNRPASVESPRKRSSLEASILELAGTKSGVVTPADVSISTGATLDKSKQTMEEMVAKGHVELRVRRGGDTVYVFPSMLSAEAREDLESIV